MGGGPFPRTRILRGATAALDATEPILDAAGSGTLGNARVHERLAIRTDRCPDGGAQAGLGFARPCEQQRGREEQAGAGVSILLAGG